MARGIVAVILGLAALAALFVAGFRGLRRAYDDMTFVPHSHDFATMNEALRSRFGTRVLLLDLPVVNRDVNGFAGLVHGTPPKGLYRGDDHTFSFERLKGRDVCLMTREPWELKDLRRVFLARFLEER